MNPKTSPSVWLLIAVNIIPLFGALFWEWNSFEIILSYCFETFVLGLIHALKMLMAKGGKIKGFMIPFFLVHYNGFVIIQTIFVLVFMLIGIDTNEVELTEEEIYKLTEMFEVGSWLGFPLALTVSHIFSYMYNYIGKGEYKNKHATNMMMEPYGRVVVQQVTVIFGAMLMMFLGSPIGLLVILIIGKMVLDARAHIKEHQKAQNPDDKSGEKMEKAYKMYLEHKKKRANKD